MTDFTSNRMVMMALGEFRFALDTAAYQSFTRTVNYRWSSQERINNRPAYQFTGTGAETIELSGTLYPLFKGGLNQIENMREIAGTGQPHILTDGLGCIWDKWVILTITEEQRVFFDNGLPRRIDFRLQLARY